MRARFSEERMQQLGYFLTLITRDKSSAPKMLSHFRTVLPPELFDAILERLTPIIVSALTFLYTSYSIIYIMENSDIHGFLTFSPENRVFLPDLSTCSKWWRVYASVVLSYLLTYEVQSKITESWLISFYWVGSFG